MGFAQAHVKRVSEGNDINDCVSTYATIKILTLAGAVAVTLSLLFLYDTSSMRRMEPTVKELVLSSWPILCSIVSQASPRLTFDARLQTTKTQLSLLVDPLIRVPLVVLLLVDRQGVIEVAWAYVLGGLGVSVVALFYLFRIKVHLDHAHPVPFIFDLCPPGARHRHRRHRALQLDKLVIGTFIAKDAVRSIAPARTCCPCSWW